ncbi:MAG: hypothetical protein QGH76_02350 [Phycisphaerales bacterium]|nr:hypothetical protein [Phycisphaerales bacterium]
MEQGFSQPPLDVAVGRIATWEPIPNTDRHKENTQRHEYPAAALCHGDAGVLGTGWLAGVVTEAGGAVSAKSTQLVILENG